MPSQVQVSYAMVNDFAIHYGASIKKTTMQVPILRPLQWSNTGDYLEDKVTSYTEPAVEITIPESKFGDLVATHKNYSSREWLLYNQMASYYGPSWPSSAAAHMDREASEIALRRKHPAVNAAWEQYQMVLALVK